MAHKRAKRSIREANRQKDGIDRAPSGNGNENPADFEKLPKNAMRVLMSAQVREDYRKRKREEQEGTTSSGAGAGGKKKKPTTTSTTPSTSSSSSKLTILPGESLLHFNRRVEDSLRSSVSASTKTAHAHTTDIARQEREERTQKHDDRVAKQQAAKAEKEAASSKTGMQGDSKPTPSTASTKPKAVALTPLEQKTLKNKKLLQEFIPAASSSAPKRLNLNDVGSAPPSLTLPRFASKAIQNNASKKKDAGEAGGTAGAAAARMGLSLAQQRILEEERERVILRYRELKERKGLGFGGGALVEE
ncbi:hypothetical protein BDY24DRAFT_395793 [Mrakia frigida]|uniref:uncharacterized protein n=1 Tax=Mrakia frigida TaxID=29902 RepID=UPI003FCC1BE6